jgi:hypothetical protein
MNKPYANVDKFLSKKVEAAATGGIDMTAFAQAIATIIDFYTKNIKPQEQAFAGQFEAQGVQEFIPLMKGIIGMNDWLKKYQANLKPAAQPTQPAGAALP